MVMYFCYYKSHYPQVSKLAKLNPCSRQEILNHATTTNKIQKESHKSNHVNFLN
jgi:hypothetical protein